MMIDPKRGTGRTWQLVNDARPGDFIVVVHGHGRDEVKRFLERQGRKVDELRVVMLADPRAADRLRAGDKDARVYVDHAAAELARMDRDAGMTMAEIEEVAHVRFGGVHQYPVAEPCHTPRQGSPYSAKPGAAGMSGASDAG